MIRSSLFIRHKIEKKDYLLPFGQAIVERRHPIEINDTVAFLWDILAEDKTIDELTDLAAKHYDLKSDEEISSLHTDIKACLDRLVKDGAVIDDNGSGRGDKDENSDGVSFATEAHGKDKSCGNILIKAKDLEVYESPDSYHLEFPVFEEYKSADYKKSDIEKDYDLEKIAKAPREEFLASRWFYGLKGLSLKRIFVHSVSILYKGELWLFAAPAGTGKSTHAEKWLADGETKIINGDLNMLGLEADKVYAYGTPWCGTSGIYDLNKYPVGGIVFLARAGYEHIEEMTEEEKILALVSRTVSPIWNKEMLESILDTAGKIVDNTIMCRLYCTKNDSAYVTMKEYVDCQKKVKEKN